MPIYSLRDAAQEIDALNPKDLGQKQVEYVIDDLCKKFLDFYVEIISPVVINQQGFICKEECTE